MYPFGQVLLLSWLLHLLEGRDEGGSRLTDSSFSPHQRSVSRPCGIFLHESMLTFNYK